MKRKHKVWMNKLFASVLMAALLLAIVCVPVMAKEDGEQEPTILAEDTSKRGKYEKHFTYSDGRNMAVAYPQAVHYQQDGQWVEIDNRLEKITGDGVTRLKNKRNSMSVVLSEKPDGEIGSIEYGDYTLKWSLRAKSNLLEKTYGSNVLSVEDHKDGIAAYAILYKSILPSLGLSDMGGGIMLEEQTYALDSDVKAVVVKEKKAARTEEEKRVTDIALTSRVEYADVLPQIDVTYTIHPEKVKEEIVMRSPTQITSYHTRVEAPGLAAALLEDRSVNFQDEAGQTIFNIPAPFMYDAHGVFSYDIVVELERLDAHVWNIVYIPSFAWLNDPARAYPVTLDPTYQATPALYGPTVTQDSYVNSGSPNSNYYTASYLKVGGSYRSYLRFPSLPSISNTHMIDSAKIVLASTSSNASNIDVYRVTGSWSPSSLTWNNKPAHSTRVASGVSINNRYYNISDATDLIAGWYSGKYANYGVMICASNSSSGVWDLYSSDCSNSNAMPWIQVMYYPMQDANLPTGTYYIQSYTNSRYLGVATGVAANGTNVETTAFHGNETQQWQITNHGNGLYTILSNAFDKYGRRSLYLDVHGGVDTQANVNLWNNSRNRFRIMFDEFTDQIAIVPSFSSTRALDVYMGNDAAQYNTNVQLYDYKHSTNQMWSFQKLNDTVFYYLDILDDYAREYAMSHGYTREQLLYNFIRTGTPSYSGNLLWGVAAGATNTGFINYVLQKNGRLSFLRNQHLYLEDATYGKIQFGHFAATLDVYQSCGLDEGGWAGDLQSTVIQAKKNTGDTDVYNTFYNEMIRLIGNVESVTNFSMPDVLADLDAKYFYEHPSSQKLGTRLRTYYASTAKDRFKNFYSGYTWTQLRDRAKMFTKDKRIGGVRQPLYYSGIYDNEPVSTVTENQALAAANAFADFIFAHR